MFMLSAHSTHLHILLCVHRDLNKYFHFIWSGNHPLAYTFIHTFLCTYMNAYAHACCMPLVWMTSLHMLFSFFTSLPYFPLSSLHFCRRRRTSKFSPGHMYDTGKASTEERELRPIDNGNSQPALSDKEKEALEESAIVPPPTEPRSAITTEGTCIHVCMCNVTQCVVHVIYVYVYSVIHSFLAISLVINYLRLLIKSKGLKCLPDSGCF